MSKKKPPIDSFERMAYREAGHAVMASYQQIPFVHFGLSLTFPERPVSRYSRIYQYCLLEPGKPTNVSRLEKYLLFLLAGAVADMIHSERYFGVAAGSARQRQYRRRWYHDTWSDPDPRLDLAYVAILSWLPGKSQIDLNRGRQELWNEACELLGRPPLWAAVEEAARRMIQHGEHLSEPDLLELLGT